MRILLLFLTLVSLAAQDAKLRKLEAEMERVSRIAGGTVGATAIHIGSGRTAHLHVDLPYPMASTYKIPIAVTLLELVDRGEEQLDRMIPIEARDLHPGSGTLTPRFSKPGVALSVRNLLELMLLISDNSATDILLRLAGGPDAVTDKMRALGFEHINVNRPTALLIADYLGVTKLPHESEWTPGMWPAIFNAVPVAEQVAAAAKFHADSRDTTSPFDMARLLVRIHKRELHHPATAELLVDILRRCESGEARLKGILPEGTVVAHKTGSMGVAITNDAGIITLPAGAGHVALAVYIKGSDRSLAARERAIAEIARTVHDYFLFQP